MCVQVLGAGGVGVALRAQPVLHDPQHPASQYAREYKTAIAARLTETAREAGATDPEQLGEQLALLIDGASARSRVLDSDCFPTAAVLIDSAVPSVAPQQPRGDLATTGPTPHAAGRPRTA